MRAQASVGLSLADGLFQMSFGNFPPLSPIKVACRGSSGASPDGASEAGREPTPAVAAFPAEVLPLVSPRPVDPMVSFGTFSPSPAKAKAVAPENVFPILSSARISLLEPAVGVAVATALSAQPKEEEEAKEHLESAATAAAEEASDEEEEEANTMLVVDDKTTLTPEGAPGAEASAAAAALLMAPVAASKAARSPPRRLLGQPERRGPSCGFGAFLAFVPCL